MPPPQISGQLVFIAVPSYGQRVHITEESS
jgi:hypothetical protein